MNKLKRKYSQEKWSNSTQEWINRGGQNKENVWKCCKWWCTSPHTNSYKTNSTWLTILFGIKIWSIRNGIHPSADFKHVCHRLKRVIDTEWQDRTASSGIDCHGNTSLRAQVQCRDLSGDYPQRSGIQLWSDPLFWNCSHSKYHQWYICIHVSSELRSFELQNLLVCII